MYFLFLIFLTPDVFGHFLLCQTCAGFDSMPTRKRFLRNVGGFRSRAPPALMALRTFRPSRFLRMCNQTARPIPEGPFFEIP